MGTLAVCGRCAGNVAPRDGHCFQCGHQSPDRTPPAAVRRVRPTRDTLIMRLHRSGWTQQAIGRLLARAGHQPLGQSRIGKILLRHGIRASDTRADRNRQVLELAETGIAQSVIAATLTNLGWPLSQGAVSKILRRNGILRQERDPVRVRLVLRLGEEGLTQQAIADHLVEVGYPRVSQPAISAILRAHGHVRRRSR